MDRREHKSISLVYEFLSEQGGLEREIINHANFLKQAGYHVQVLTCYLDKKLLELLPFQGITIKEISTFKTPWEAVNLILCFFGFNNLKKIKSDAFLSYSAPCNFLLRNNKGKKINYINHFPHFLYLNKKEKIEWASSTKGLKRWISVILSWFLGSILKKTDMSLVKKNNLNFVNSNFTKKTIESIYMIKTLVSYPPIDPQFKPVQTNKTKEKYIFSSSRIIPDKKYEWVIEALSFTKNKLPLYVAGSVEPEYKNKLINLAYKQGVRLVFLGKLKTESIREYYSNAECFVFPAPGEDFGLVPAESLACGTPCIVWVDNAGPTEQVKEGINGYLAKPYDTKDFARKIDICLDSNFKKKNRKLILESAKKFSAEEVKKDFIKKINSLF